jgi:hypothetical protein
VDIAAIDALAGTASTALVTAAATDLFESVRNRVAKLFGRVRPDRAIEQRMEATRDRLANAGATGIEQVRASLTAQWQTRLADLLTDHPDAQTELVTLIAEIKRQLPGAIARDHSVVTGRDASITAAGSGIAAGLIDGNVTQYVVATQMPERAGRPVRLPPRPVDLIGREDLLADLHQRLASQDGLSPRLVALRGVGGCGKTSVAAEYAYRHKAEVGVAWWFPAEDRTGLEAEFARLAPLLGAAGAMFEPRDPVVSVHAVLADSPQPWLLVFDNAPDAGSVREFLPPAGMGRVLITSQNASWPPSQAVEVMPLELQVAGDFLVNQTGDADRAAAAELASALDGLPLALEQAVAYARETGLSLAEYLELFRQRQIDLLARGRAAEHPDTVTTTLGLALSRLEVDSRTAPGLLRLLACMAPEPVPLGLLLACQRVPKGLDDDVTALLNTLIEDRLARQDAIAALRRYSLTTPGTNHTLLVHRLVQLVTLDQTGEGLADAWRHAAIALIEAAIPADSELPAAWPDCAALVPHALAVLPSDSSGLWKVATYLGHSGSYPAARQIWQKIADAHEAISGAENRDTLNARAHLASWTGHAGYAVEAAELYAELVPTFERVLGTTDPSTLSTRANLAYWTGHSGHPNQARELYAELLPVRERVLGGADPSTLTTRANLAFWTGHSGNPDRARELYAELLPVRESMLGAEHPDTLIDRANLARWTGEAGNPGKARDLYDEVQPVHERVFGSEHPYTLAVRQELADWTGEAGDPARARDLYAQVLPVLERVLGSEHRNTIAAHAQSDHWKAQADLVGFVS